jgi:hypothetical protein
VGHSLVGQLRHDGKNAIPVAVVPEDTHRLSQIDILKHQGGIDEIDGVKDRRGRLDIRIIQLESGNAPSVASSRLFDVFRIDVDPNYSLSVSPDKAVEAVSARAADDGYAGRQVRSDEGIQLICNQL